MKPTNEASGGEGAISSSEAGRGVGPGVLAFRVVVYAHCVVVLLTPFCHPILNYFSEVRACLLPMLIVLGMVTLASQAAPAILIVLLVVYRLPAWRAVLFVLFDTVLLFVQWRWIGVIFA